MAVDQVARDSAQAALSKIDAHERVCAERDKEAQTWRVSTTEKLDGMFEGLNTGHKNIAKSVDGLNGQVRAAGIFFIVLLLGAVGFLIKNHGL